MLLLPEDLSQLETTSQQGLRLMVTGAYTAQDRRDGGLPKPVGLFVDRGVLVNPNLGRMDGVLLIDSAMDNVELQHRARLSWAGTEYDLTELDQRYGFIAQASEQGLSVVQSHLLIVEGQVDVRPNEIAPEFVRRMLFTDTTGFGIYQTRQSRSLYDAATQIAQEYTPRMVLNLDMGSYDYCLRAENGVETECGALGRDDTGKLSNLLVLSLE